MHTGQDLLSIRKFAMLIKEVFNIKKEECVHLGILYMLIHGDLPPPAVIQASGDFIAQHCYMFAKYFKEKLVAQIDDAGNVKVGQELLV